MVEMDVQSLRVGKKQKSSNSIASALVSAVLEWLLICMLFVGGMFSYLVTKFARRSKLQVPCLFCSRLDHVLEKDRGGFCWDLVCKNHKLKISSSIFCQLHDKLVDVHEVCESCFFSFATVNKSNSETYRLLVGKLGEEPHPGLSQGEDDNLDSSRIRKCLCCNAEWSSRSYTQTLIQTKSIDSEVNVVDEGANDLVRGMENPEADSVAKIAKSIDSEVNFIDESADDLVCEMDTQKTDPVAKIVKSVDSEVNLVDESADDLVREMDTQEADSVAKIAKSIGSEVNVVDESASDLVREMEIAEIDSVAKIAESNGSEVNVVDESANDLAREMEIPDIDSVAKNAKSIDSDVNMVDKSADDLVHEMETPEIDSVANTPTAEPQIFTQADSSPDLHLVNPTHDLHLESEETTNSFSEEPLPHGLEELTWQQAERTDSIGVPSELISFDDAPPSKIDETQYDLKETIISTTELEKEVSTYQEEAPAQESDSRDTTESVKNVAAECAETSDSQSNSISETCRAGSDSIVENIPMDSKSIKTDSSSQLDLGDAYKLALGTKGRQLSGRFLENQKSMTDSSRAFEDLKILLTQISANGDISPRLSPIYDDYKSMESPRSVGMQMFQRKISLERNESNLSLDGSTISEIEGESSVDRLKRQLEHDKKIMSALYKELEEERNASAIAANQAMAMITRLQEEKAALNMEALQFLRMMEEQAEYDGEALQRTNELLTEKEKQVQDLEYELEQYRNQSEVASLSDTLVNPSSESRGNMAVEKLQGDYLESDTTAFQNVEK